MRTKKVKEEKKPIKSYWYARLAFFTALIYLIVFFTGLIYFAYKGGLDVLLYVSAIILYVGLEKVDKYATRKTEETPKND